MPADDEYELLPHEEVEQLRRDVDRLKKNPFGEGKNSQDLLTSINDLRHAIEALHALFTQANQEMVHDYRATSIKDHFKIISQQNENIAQGIVSVANLLQQQMAPLQQAPMPQQNPDSPPDFPTPSRVMPTQQPMTPQQNVVPDPNSIIPNSSGLIGGQIPRPQSQAEFEMQQTLQQQSPSQQSYGFLGNQPTAMPPLPPPPKKKGLFK